MTAPRDPPERPTIRRGGEVLAGGHPGDRTLRITRPVSREVAVPRLAPRRPQRNPAVVLVYGFALLTFAGALLLALPLSTASGDWAPFLVALFTATSAVCVTGLVVVETGSYWSPFGHLVIVLLVQLGGLGFMAASTLLFLLFGHRVTLRERLLLRESLGTGDLRSVVPLVRRIFIFTLALEAAGAAAFTLAFLLHTGAGQALWWGVFHSISAFNNAGFDLFGSSSLQPFSQDPAIVVTAGLLLLAGSVSFLVVQDLLQARRFVRFALDTKLVLVGTAGITVIGALGLLFTERQNLDTIGAMGPASAAMNALFMTVSRTAGFATVPVGAMTEGALFLLIALMFIGGSAGSTAGGIKVQTFSLLFFAVLSAARGLGEVEAFRRRVPTATILRALTVALLALAFVFTVSFALTVTEEVSFLPLLFETFSAFSTVGLSTGITPDLSPAGRIILVLTMFVGRLGPLTLVLALSAREPRAGYRWPEASVRIG